MLNQPYTYLHRRLDTNQVFYVGKGRRNRAHECSGARRSAHWNAVAKKHGCLVEIVAHWATDAEAYAHEAMLIQALSGMGHPLVNHAAGGAGAPGVTQTSESNAKRSASLKSVYASPALREMLRNRSSAMWRSPEKRASMLATLNDPDFLLRRAETAREAARRPEVAARKSAASISVWARPEYKTKMCAIRKASMQDSALRNARARKLVCIETGVEYASIKEAARLTGLAQSSIAGVCSGTVRAAGKGSTKKTFRYLEATK